MSEFLGPTAYARHRNISLTSVQHAVKMGHIQRGADGLINVAQADIDWDKNVDKTKSRRKPVSAEVALRQGQKKAATWAAKRKAEAPTIELPADGGAPKRTVNPTYNESRASKEYYEAEMRRLDYELKRGTMVLKADVAKAAFNRYRVFRDAMLNIPNRIASQVATETDAGVIHELLFNEIRQTLEDFTDNREVAA